MNSIDMINDFNNNNWKDISVDEYKDKIDLIDVKNNNFINLRNNISIDEYKKNIGKDVMLWIDNVYGLEGCSAKLHSVGKDSITVDKCGELFDIKLCNIKEGEFLLDKAIDIDLNTEYIAKITNVYNRSIKVIVMLEEVDGVADDELTLCYINKDTEKFEYSYYPTRLIKDITIISEVK